MSVIFVGLGVVIALIAAFASGTLYGGGSRRCRVHRDGDEVEFDAPTVAEVERLMKLDTHRRGPVAPPKTYGFSGRGATRAEVKRFIRQVGVPADLPERRLVPTEVNDGPIDCWPQGS